MDSLEPIKRKIYEIRGRRVMLDFDLADAYGVKTAQLKRQVRRNIERFEGDDFMFEVTADELSRCQIGTLNIKLYNRIAESINYAYCTDDNRYVDLGAGFDGVLYPLELFDYIYAVLHSPSYRERYKEFLKIDFPRIPHPTIL